MRAAVFAGGKLDIRSIEPPVMGPNQLRVSPIAVGICGSDLSAREHTEEFLQWNSDIGATGTAFDPGTGVVLGHEFTSRITEVGSNVAGYAVGDKIVTLPHAVGPNGVRYTVGYSNAYPGGLAEDVVVEASGHLLIPDGVPAVEAAVTEPMATGLNAVLRSRIAPPDGALVTGCGPVGLGAVVELSARNVYPIVASDPSLRRRQAAAAMGADQTIDPLVDDPVTAWLDLACPGQRLFVFEAAGRAGLLNKLLYRVPNFSKIVVVGVCSTDDVIRPGVGVSKNISIDFVGGPGYRDDSYYAFDAMFRHIARGKVDLQSVVTGYTGLQGVPAVFDSLRPKDPSDIEHIKVLVCHDLSSSEILDSRPTAPA